MAKGHVSIRVMIEWSEMHLAIRDAFRRFVEAEIKPNLQELEHGDTPPYAMLRKMVETFGLADMARARFAKDLAREARILRRPRASASPRPKPGTSWPCR